MNRYNRHLILEEPKIDLKKLDQNISIIGCGGTGTTFSYLATTLGIKQIQLIDGDIIDISNLGRQNLFFECDIGFPKALVLSEKLNKINSQINIKYLVENINQENVNKIQGNIIVDCTDNIEIRMFLNEFCIKNNKTLISSAAIKTQGYVFTKTKNSNGACLNCFLEGKHSDTKCGIDGILNGTLFMCGSIMISELIRVINEESTGKLIKFNSYNYGINSFSIKKNPECRVCVKKLFDNLESKKKIIRNYCNGIIEKNMTDFDLEKYKSKLIGKLDFNDFKIGIRTELFTVFDSGRVLIKSDNDETAERIFHEYFG